MADAFAASATRSKGSKTTPFDQILHLEQEQEQRLASEITALEAAERAEQETLQKRQTERVEQSRAAALEELRSFKQKELPTLLKKAEETAAAERARIEKASGGAKKSAIATLVERMLSPDVLSRLQ